VFGLAFKVFLLLKKQKVKPNSSVFFQVLLEKLLFRSSILKAPSEVLLPAVGLFNFEIR
jgi:hypothetical protein